jgi:hypothetical protein
MLPRRAGDATFLSSPDIDTDDVTDDVTDDQQGCRGERSGEDVAPVPRSRWRLSVQGGGRPWCIAW